MEQTEILGKLSLLQHLSEEDLQLLVHRVVSVSLADGPVFKENDPSDGLFIIRKGTAKVTKSSESGDAEAVLNLLRPGDSFGEIGIIDGLPRTAAVTAMGPMECWFLSRAEFQELLEQRPKMAIPLLMSMAAMVRHADQWVARAV